MTGVKTAVTEIDIRGTGLDLRDYLRVLRRNWLVIVAAALTGTLLGGAATLLTRPTYTAETQLFVAIQNSGSVLELQQGNTFSQARVQSYVKTVGSPAVLQPVIDSLGLSTTADELAQRVKASSDMNTVLINIAVSDGSPVQAAAIAQGVADSLVKAVDSLERPKNGGSSPVGLSIIKPAKAPTQPSAPNTRLNLIAGFVIGLILGIGASVLRTTLDSRIRGEADLRHVTKAPLLGGIAFDGEVTKKPLLTQSAPQSPRAEAFRQLRTNLQFANVSGRAKSVLVTSSLPGEGKSTTATNLAIALAQAGQTVCLVDADLRRPKINEYLGLDRNAGLTTALLGIADAGELLQQWGEDNLFVLTSGQVPPNPSELLGSTEMEQLITQLELSFDTVIVDAPPLLPVTDAAVLSQHVGGVLVVVGSHKIRQQDLAKALGSLEMVDSTVLGIVLNRLPVKGPDAYSYTYYSNDAQVEQRNEEGPGKRKGRSNRSPRRLEDLPSQERPARIFPAGRR
ncbi:polysaccharide biosynthesis tyrosine autokinase [Arthrobacter sp. M4]|uniref:polysaccharide biosynthesis tyrosine autokinase n=1 Tax=Arthrobacter sp. M4 TaxID=218160 RepID=UPI001CDBBF6B|nr:polysaccharide biosynthesis tyrosine autokinase [Arthrobacter sp. M4]MCA4133059.1 polysaccharide biosynthesis tyrosine autokinase [Arthrobacter sp. M4]